MSAPSLEVVQPEPYEDELDTGVPVTDAWHIQDIPTADWALGRVCDLEREIAENEAVADLAISRIHLRTQALNARAQRGVEFFKGRIAAFAESHREALLGGGKKKTRSLLHGSISWRKSGGGLQVQDKEALLDWARLQPAELGFVRIKEEAAVDEVKKAFKATGEVPPGCDVAPEGEEVIVKAELSERSNDA